MACAAAAISPPQILEKGDDADDAQAGDIGERSWINAGQASRQQKQGLNDVAFAEKILL